ncbi:hypothetical protein CE91St41_40400 [Oscillospiraceae bacterium]|nr:hypothetical protein CE91St40_40370 [Oscillospiraceae bacterium]BDF77151.1 hypothetical protein CE91St41_40400 [Oscillospiraceae bacterium]
MPPGYKKADQSADWSAFLIPPVSRPAARVGVVFGGVNPPKTNFNLFCFAKGRAAPALSLRAAQSGGVAIGF